VHSRTTISSLLSPERLLKISDSGLLESKPIKGTRPRGRTPAEDKMLSLDLATSEKDRSENLMITDLVRNDLGRVCEIGSVKVPKMMEVESYWNVHQLVTTISGTKRKSKFNNIDCVMSLFPPGSMTGAPKLRSMELLHQLEIGNPRGLYSGSIGYFSVTDSADLNVVIRTIVVTPEKMSIGAGGAIVALSNENDEYDEMLLKANSVLSPVKTFF